MKVSKQLLLGFGAVTAIGLCTAGYGAMVMNTLSDSVTKLATDRMVKVSQLTAVMDNYNEAARHARNIVISDDAAFRLAEKKSIDEQRLANVEILQALDKTMIIPSARELLKAINEQRPTFSAAMDRATDAAMRGDKAAASASLLGEVRTAQSGLFKAVADLRDLQQKLAAEQAGESVGTARSGTLVLVALALLMGAIGTVVSWLLARSLRRALGAEPDQLASAARRVADGDLSQPLAVPATLSRWSSCSTCAGGSPEWSLIRCPT